MVGVINPNASTSLATQRQLALQASYQLSPGEAFPSEAETPSSSTLPNGTALQQPAFPSHGSGKLSAGAIAGIVVACLSVVLLGVLLAFFWGRLKTLKDEARRKDSTVVRSTEPRNTWFLAGSPSTHAWPSPATHTHTHTQPSPPYSAVAHVERERDRNRDRDAESPMSSHAVPPAYYESPTPYSTTATSQNNTAVGLGIAGEGTPHVSRAASHRSVGGTFAWSPATGYYTRTHESAKTPHADAGAHAEAHEYVLTRTSDMTSPVDPALVPPSDLQRLNRTPEVREGYIDEKGRFVGRHVNREEPAEMPDTSLQRGRF
jgi:hypothetical protein